AHLALLAHERLGHVVHLDERVSHRGPSPIPIVPRRQPRTRIRSPFLSSGGGSSTTRSLPSSPFFTRIESPSASPSSSHALFTVAPSTTRQRAPPASCRSAARGTRT